MEYFILAQDTRICPAIHIPISRYMSITDAKNLNLDKLNPLTVVVRSGRADEVYPDLLSRQLFLVSTALNEVIALFMPKAPYKLFCFWDQQKKEDFYYYAYSLPIVDCLADPGAVNRGGPVVLKRETIGRPDLLKAAGTDRHLFLASLPAAEAILRMRLKGIRLLKTTFE